jgi:hypothetical protein
MGAYNLPEALRITIGKEPENKACVEGLKQFLAAGAQPRVKEHSPDR